MGVEVILGAIVSALFGPLAHDVWDRVKGRPTVSSLLAVLKDGVKTGAFKPQAAAAAIVALESVAKHSTALEHSMSRRATVRPGFIEGAVAQELVDRASNAVKELSDGAIVSGCTLPEITPPHVSIEDYSGQKFAGNYTVGEMLGSGGFGSVWSAEDSLGNRVALKVPHVGSPIEEGMLLTKLQHPNIVGVRTAYADHTPPFFVMEHVDGATLDTFRGEATLGVEETVKILTQMLKGLAYAHEQGIIHRDLKPANTMLTRDGVVKLLDFGLGKKTQSLNVLVSGAMELSGASQTVGAGSWEYMAPEQKVGGKIDHRVDLYAFGVTLFELLVGRRPIPGDELADEVELGIYKEPLSQIFERCWVKVEKRAQSANELLVLLMPSSRDTLTKIRTVPKPPQTQGFKWLWIGVAALVAVGFVVASFVQGEPTADEEPPSKPAESTSVVPSAAVPQPDTSSTRSEDGGGPEAEQESAMASSPAPAAAKALDPVAQRRQYLLDLKKAVRGRKLEEAFEHYDALVSLDPSNKEYALANQEIERLATHVVVNTAKDTKAPYLSLRLRADKNSQLLAQMSDGSKLRILESEPGKRWAKVAYLKFEDEGWRYTEGWAHRGYMESRVKVRAKAFKDSSCGQNKSYVGTWMLTTVVTETKSGRRSGGVGTNGFYKMTVRASDDAFEGELRKEGYGRGFPDKKDEKSADYFSKSGQWAGSCFHRLAVDLDGQSSNSQVLYMRKVGSELQGFWHYTGNSWKTSGLRGKFRAHKAGYYLSLSNNTNLHDSVEKVVKECEFTGLSDVTIFCDESSSNP